MSKAGSGTDNPGGQNSSTKVLPQVGAGWGLKEQQGASVARAASRRRMRT